ncbi:MAG: family 16 glycosylhydrolase [Candidatus Gottesmanbacteria bacterium]
MDGSKWRILDNECWTANNEIEIYNKGAFSVAGGILRITASKTEAVCDDSSTRYFQSGRMDTRYKFSQAYGYFEARMKVPKGKGLWPAWWMYPPDQWPPEIDITEILGGQIYTTYMTYHWPVGSSYQSSGSSWGGSDFSQDFHIFAVDWEPGVIIWYVDGVERWRYSNENVTSIPLRLVLNLAVGGWAGTPDANTIFPAYMDVDHVRVYKKVSGPPPANNLTVRAKGTYAGSAWPNMEIWVDGVKITNTTIGSTSYADYNFSVSTSAQKIDVVFTNDYYDPTTGADRNLFVDYIIINGKTIQSESPGVILDKGSGSAAFDGINTIPGQEAISWNGALRFNVSSDTTPPASPSGLTVN